MAELKITSAALAQIHRIVESDAIASPLVSVHWVEGVGDVRRGSAGEVLWEREPPRWAATVLDLDEVNAATGETFEERVPIKEVHGFKLFAVGKPDNLQLEGCTLDFVDKEFVVRELV